MTSTILSFILLTSASLGGGAFILVLTRTHFDFANFERVAISFSIGVGALGWSIFWLAAGGFLSRLELMVLLCALSTGCFFLRPTILKNGTYYTFNKWTLCLVIILVLLLFYDFIEGISPPADGDSLAYHFALPKSFLTNGGLFPIYRAVEGSIPLLQQMGYLAALGIGGEKTMTLWTMATGWGAATMVYILARRYMTLNWALAIALIFLSAPAVVFGAGSGQVEVRNAGFVVATALAVSDARRYGLLKFAALAGIAAGFFVASKYTGLIFAIAAGVVLIWHKRWLGFGAVYTLALILAGSQWYFWNAHITGDPVFPLLYNWLEYRPEVPWNAALQSVYHLGLGNNPLDVNIFSFFFYPIKATLFPHVSFESLRIGFGPFVLLLAPFTLLAIWKLRKNLTDHALFAMGCICLVTYAIWFFTGQSQKVRHLLPIYPLLLVCISAAAYRFTKISPNIYPAVIIAFLTSILIQFGCASIFSINYARYVLGGQNKETFLQRNVPGYAAIKLVNAALLDSDHLLTAQRQLIYYFDIPVFYANPLLQAEVELHPKASEPRVLWHQLVRRKVSHLLLELEIGSLNNGSTLNKNLKDLLDNKCLLLINTFPAKGFRSRTLQNWEKRELKFSLFKTLPEKCRYMKDFKSKSTLDSYRHSMSFA